MAKRAAKKSAKSELLQRVPFQKLLLSGQVQKLVAKMDEAPSEMFQCTLGEHYDGVGKHFEYLLIHAKRESHSNVVDHFNGHKKVKEYMESIAKLQKELKEKGK